MSAPPLPTSADRRTAVEVARACATAAEAIIRQNFGRAAAHAKGASARDLVTETDGAVERAIVAVLRGAFPEHAILAEESATDVWSDGWMWVCDPIDGTRNFSQGIPHIGFSLALCHGGEPMLGLITHPLLGWEYLATAGNGCTFNGEPCSASAKAALAGCIVGIDLGYDPAGGAEQLALAQWVWPEITSIRTSGSAALGFAFVASGQWDIYVHRELKPWDSAAGLLLVREAGGSVVDQSSLARSTIRSAEVIASAPGVADVFAALAARRPGSA